MKIQQIKQKHIDLYRKMGRKHKYLSSKGHSTSKSKHESNGRRKDELDEDDTWYRDIHISTITGVALLALYVKCLYPSVPGGDAGELIVSAHELGVAHPPGYPLFTLLAKLFMVVIPRGSIAWRVNLLTAVCSAMAGSVLQFTVLRITGCIGSSFLAIGLFSINKLTWTWSVSAEVFSLNNLLVAALMLTAVLFEADDEPRHVEKIACIGTFISGLALCNQHTIIIYIICIAFWVLIRLMQLQMLHWRLLLKMMCMFLLGLSVYLYLPISSYQNTARWTWGDHRTIQGFITHFFRREYGTFDLGKDQEGSGLWIIIKAYWEHAHENLCELGPFLGLIGVAVAFIWQVRGEGSSVLVFSCMFVIYTFFFAWRANLDISNPLFKGVVQRFFMQSDIVLALLAAVGFHMASRLITERLMGVKQLPMAAVFTMMGAGIIIILQLKNFMSCDQSSNYVIRDFAKSLLNKMPRNALVLSKGDLPTNTLRYYHLCEKVRPDLTILDVEVLSYGWFLPLMKKFYPNVTFPGDLWQLTNRKMEDGRRSFNYRNLLEKNQNKRPVIACIGMQERDPSWKDSFLTLPFGPCLQVVPHNYPFDPVIWANRTGGYADGWTYRHHNRQFPVDSWEKVANDEMWQAKISTAFFMYQQGNQAKDPEMQSKLLIKSYELYFRAIKLNQIPGRLVTKESFPLFWYKNFALSCEKLLHADHALDKMKLCKLAISNFKQYIHLERTDPDEEKIAEAITILNQKLDTMMKLDKFDDHLGNMADRVDKMGVEELLKNNS